MRIGQIYRSAKNGNKARITLLDKKNDTVEIEWFWVDGGPCPKDKTAWPLSSIEELVKKGDIQIYDDLPNKDPNALFMKEKKL